MKIIFYVDYVIVTIYYNKSFTIFFTFELSLRVKRSF
ncbi:hypothetical protein DFO77_10249 [Marinilabilia salmonicolor]|jgi:hypothetical protein|uniref:Uncharacterized protein n=1 Tax=Marinilabilia salmonicolor TaxID=989 RepID=A0A2T0XIT7_9BACT|nr:hypothetical protein BY457_109100 [Marinilabilia salmonicolor]RCW38895.1 hypothetical protein DFO77_10249 [Marinilabilia salmonicolor]